MRMIIGGLFGRILGRILGAQNGSIDYMVNAENDVLKVLFIVLLGPLLEEILFRKLLIDRTRIFGEKNAILFSALLFALFHTNLFQFFYTLGMGLIFGCIYVQTGKVLYTWVMHALINFFYGVIPGWLLRWGLYDKTFYWLILSGIVIVGIILLSRNRKEWKLAPMAEGSGEKVLRRNMLLNAGVIAFYVVSTAVMVLIMFPELYRTLLAKIIT